MTVDNCFSYWQYLNDNSGGIQAISATLTVAVTVVLAVITWRYVLLTRQLASVSESQLQFQKDTNIDRQRQEIIDNSLRYIFRLKDNINQLRIIRADFLDKKKKYPEKAWDLEEKLINEENKRIGSMAFSELMFTSFQLKRINGLNLWKDFEELMDIFELTLNKLLSCQDSAEFDTIEKGLNDRMNEIVNNSLQASIVIGV